MPAVTEPDCMGVTYVISDMFSSLQVPAGSLSLLRKEEALLCSALSTVVSALRTAVSGYRHHYNRSTGYHAGFLLTLGQSTPSMDRLCVLRTLEKLDMSNFAMVYTMANDEREAEPHICVSYT